MDHSSPARGLYGVTEAARRELIILGVALLVGLFVAPVAIWFAGGRTLGTYAGGSLGHLVGNFFRGLASGSPPFWAVVVGPYVVCVLVRVLVRLLRPRETAA